MAKKFNRIPFNDHWSVDFKANVVIRLKDNKEFRWIRRGFGVELPKDKVPGYLRNFVNTCVSKEK